MKMLVLAVALAVMQTTPPVPRQTAHNQASQSTKHQRKADGDQGNSAPPTVKSTPTSNQGNGSSNPTSPSDTQEAISVRELPAVTVSVDWWSRASVILTGIYVVLTAALVIVGGFGVCYARRSLRAINNQLRAMQDQRREMHDQVEQMKAAGLQTDALIKRASQQAVAMKASAKAGIVAARASLNAAVAARDNIEMFINKERGRLRVDLKPLELKLSAEKTAYTVDYTVTLYGTTPATIVEAKCAVFPCPSDAIEEAELMDMAMLDIHSFPAFPSFFAPNAPPVECYAFPFIDDKNDWMLSEVMKDNMFIVVRGFIKYRDVFDRERETRFRYIWRYSGLLPMDNPADGYGTWEKCGPKEQNAET